MSIISGLLDLIFPPRCAFCRKVVNNSEYCFCADCEGKIPYTPNGGAQKGDFYSVCVSPLYYEDIVRESIHRFKFKEATAYAKIYGKLISRCVSDNLRGRYDFISWVPLSEKRLRRRGYDQAMLLAMAAALELGDVAVETIIKHTDVPAQSGVGSEEKRRANVSGAYKVRDPELIRDKRILLVDDIITTGSTLSECSRILLAEGTREVLCATLARGRD